MRTAVLTVTLPPSRWDRESNGRTGESNGLTGKSNGLTGKSNGLTGKSNGLTGKSNGLTVKSNGLTVKSNGLTGEGNGLTGMVIPQKVNSLVYPSPCVRIILRPGIDPIGTHAWAQHTNRTSTEGGAP